MTAAVAAHPATTSPNPIPNNRTLSYRTMGALSAKQNRELRLHTVRVGAPAC